MADESRESQSWDALRETLLNVERDGDGALWDLDEIHAALEEANAKGLKPKLILSCWESCRSQNEFSSQLRKLISGRKKRLLSVDDEESFGELLKMNLEKTGRYQVEMECDPRRALEHAKVFKPDLLILDVVMPGLSGPELVRQLRDDEATRNLPIIMLTSLLEGSEAGAVTREGILYISKPVRTNQLIHCIEEHLDAAAGRFAERSGGGFTDPF